ncbi:MAG: hypothetical protein EXR87_05755 [Gammaproteobacteria bacterium]|nr:hypothetical protein [Gammaproteobacteria bacterium]
MPRSSRCTAACAAKTGAGSTGSAGRSSPSSARLKAVIESTSIDAGHVARPCYPQTWGSSAHNEVTEHACKDSRRQPVGGAILRRGWAQVAAAGGSGRRGAVAHHAAGGESRPRKQVANVFARRIVTELVAAKRHRQFDRLVLIVAPSFLGILRKALPQSLQTAVEAEVAKDLQHQTVDEVRAHIPQSVFQTIR